MVAYVETMSESSKQQAVPESKAYGGSDSRKSDRLQDMRQSMKNGPRPTVIDAQWKKLGNGRSEYGCTCVSRNMQEMVALALSTCL